MRGSPSGLPLLLLAVKAGPIDLSFSHLYISAMRIVSGRFTIGCCILFLCGCQPATRPPETEASDAPIFAPIDIRLHPFTAIKDWTGDNRIDGVEALVELQDRFRDPTKATGTCLFELYEYRRNFPDQRGERLAAWRGSLLTLEEQRAHWNRISRTYSFQLTYPQISANKSYVLQVWFESTGKRLTNQVVLEQQERKSDSPTTVPVTRPTTGASTTPAKS